MFSNSALEMLTLILQLKIVPVKRSYNLLHANGKIYYGVSNKYNIPVIIYFLEFYPHRPPNVWVNCPDDTIIKEGVECVASSGEVTHPYLRNWGHSSNLVSLVMQLSNECALKKPFVVPNFNGRLSLEKTKLAKIIIDNGQNDLLWHIREDAQAFFDQKFGLLHKSRADQMSSLHSVHDFPQQEIPPAVKNHISNLLFKQGLLPSNYVIKQNLVHVAPSGMVCLAYLHNWDRLESRANLIGLISHLSAEFTCQPPLMIRGGSEDSCG
ncbi:unnamed protein product [Arabidopsis halleri]